MEYQLPHSANVITLEISTSLRDSAVVHSLRNRFYGYFNSWLSESISNILDEFIGKDEIVKVERLVVDIGVLHPQLSLENFKNILSSGLIQALAYRLDKGVLDIKDTKIRNGVCIDYFSKTNGGLGTDVGTRVAASKQYDAFLLKDLDPLSYLTETLSYFAKTGTYPWWFNEPYVQACLGITSSVTISIITNYVESRRPELIDDIIISNFRHSTCLDRMIKQLSSKYIYSFVERFAFFQDDTKNEFLLLIKQMKHNNRRGYYSQNIHFTLDVLFKTVYLLRNELVDSKEIHKTLMYFNKSRENVTVYGNTILSEDYGVQFSHSTKPIIRIPEKSPKPLLNPKTDFSIVKYIYKNALRLVILKLSEIYNTPPLSGSTDIPDSNNYYEIYKNIEKLILDEFDIINHRFCNLAHSIKQLSSDTIDELINEDFNLDRNLFTDSAIDYFVNVLGISDNPIVSRIVSDYTGKIFGFDSSNSNEMQIDWLASIFHTPPKIVNDAAVLVEIVLDNNRKSRGIELLKTYAVKRKPEESIQDDAHNHKFSAEKDVCNSQPSQKQSKKEVSKRKTISSFFRGNDNGEDVTGIFFHSTDSIYKESNVPQNIVLPDNTHHPFSSNTSDSAEHANVKNNVETSGLPKYLTSHDSGHAVLVTQQDAPAEVTGDIANTIFTNILGHSLKSITAKSYLNNKFDYLDEIHVKNAGLVILLPFLKSFFEKLGYTSKNCHLYEERKVDAIVALQYLASGRDIFEEPDIPFNKIICSFPLDMTFETNNAMDPAAVSECDALIEYVIEQWTALGSISKQGFRTAFLHRDGVIRRNNGAWIVRIEKKTLDVLLDRIPWSFSIVKLPWLKELIYVEW